MDENGLLLDDDLFFMEEVTDDDGQLSADSSGSDRAAW